MTEELCGVMTENGPCTMKKGHSATWHRHRQYPEMKWILSDKRTKQQLAHGVGVNPLTYAISRNRVNGITLLIEIRC